MVWNWLTLLHSAIFKNRLCPPKLGSLSSKKCCSPGSLTTGITTMVKSSASMPEAVVHESGSQMANKIKELMSYFNALPAVDCAQLLVSLQDYNPNVHTVPAGNANMTFPHPTRSLDDYMSQVDTTCNEEVKNQLYKEAKAKEA